MPEINLRQPGFTNHCGPFTKNKETTQKFKETGDSGHIYQNEVDKACFQHDIAYGNFKFLLEEQLLIKYCMIRHLILLKIRTIMNINVDLLQWIINFMIKKVQAEKLKMKMFLIRN